MSNDELLALARRELEAAQGIFLAYEALHLEKGSDDGNEKAKRNRAYADSIGKTLEALTRTPLPQGASPSPLLSERHLCAGVDHAPSSAARNGGDASPIGRDAKLNELILLAMAAATDELGWGWEEAVFKKHANRAAELWQQHLAVSGGASAEDVDAK